MIYHLSKHRFVTHFCAILASFSTIFVLFSDIFSFILGSAIRREKCDSFHFRYFSPIKKSPALCRTSIFDRTATSYFFQRIPALFVFMSLYVRCVHGMAVLFNIHVAIFFATHFTLCRYCCLVSLVVATMPSFFLLCFGKRKQTAHFSIYDVLSKTKNEPRCTRNSFL